MCHRDERAAPVLPTPTGSDDARCGPIHPEDDWHLDHTADRNGYLGPSHARCNLAAAAAVTNGRRPPQPFVERPYTWSQRWYDDPPIGTIAGPDSYLGNGEWQPTRRIIG